MSERTFEVRLSDPASALEFTSGYYWTVTKEGGLRVSGREKAGPEAGPAESSAEVGKVAEWAPGFWTSIKEITNE